VEASGIAASQSQAPELMRTSSTARDAEESEPPQQERQSFAGAVAAPAVAKPRVRGSLSIPPQQALQMQAAAAEIERSQQFEAMGRAKGALESFAEEEEDVEQRLQQQHRQQQQERQSFAGAVAF
jgi:hypothetical protein